MSEMLVEIANLQPVSLPDGLPVRIEQPELVLDPAQPWQQCLSLLDGRRAAGIRFAKATDGRGLSLAARIRESGSDVELHAVGALHADMLYFLRRCGFDVCHLPLRDPSLFDATTAKIERSLLHPFSDHYQSAADGSAGLVGQSEAAVCSRLRSA